MRWCCARTFPLLRGAAAVREFFFSALESGLGEVEVEPIRVEVVGDLAHEVGTLQRAGSGHYRQAPRRAWQVSVGLRQAKRRRMEADLGMLVERPDSDQCGIGHSESRRSVVGIEGAAKKKLAAVPGLRSQVWVLGLGPMIQRSRPGFLQTFTPSFAKSPCN
jgi:hypothetical protein